MTTKEIVILLAAIVGFFLLVYTVTTVAPPAIKTALIGLAIVGMVGLGILEQATKAFTVRVPQEDMRPAAASVPVYDLFWAAYDGASGEVQSRLVGGPGGEAPVAAYRAVLHGACAGGCPVIVATILRANLDGITPSSADEYGQTALHFAAGCFSEDDLEETRRSWFRADSATRRYGEVAELLLSQGAATHLRDVMRKRTPLEWAEASGRSEVAVALRRHGARV